MPPRAAALTRTAGTDPALAMHEHLVERTAVLIGEIGVVGLTTRQIARHAEVADGVLYNHFADKDDLVVEAIHRHLEAMDAELTAAAPEAMTRTVVANLTGFLLHLVDAHERLAPIIAGLLAEPELRIRVRDRLARSTIGLDRGQQLLVRYLQDERRAGRLHDGVDLTSAAALLVGAGHDLALGPLIMPSGRHSNPRATVRRLVAVVIDGIGPA